MTTTVSAVTQDMLDETIKYRPSFGPNVKENAAETSKLLLEDDLNSFHRFAQRSLPPPESEVGPKNEVVLDADRIPDADGINAAETSKLLLEDDLNSSHRFAQRSLPPPESEVGPKNEVVLDADRIPDADGMIVHRPLPLFNQGLDRGLGTLSRPNLTLKMLMN
jgi:hypothetical protein